MDSNEDNILECQRFGRPRKALSIKEVLRKYKADIVMIQESKKFSLERQCFRFFWGGRNKDWTFTRAEGTNGGYDYSMENQSV